jgi:glycosyltransferase involved in cell wall biosynthesis
MYSEALQELRGWIGKRVFLVSEFESSAREYQGLLGESVSILPHPALPPETPISRGTERDESPVVGLLGYSKREKGFHLLPSIISAVWARREFEQTRFLVQVNHGGYDTAVAEAEAWLRNVAGPKLRLLEGPQSTEAYHAALAEVDVVLLPYDPELYRGRGSGVFSEAVSFAKPIVAPEQSGLGEELAKERAAGVTFAHHEGGAIAASVLAVLERRGDFHSTAVRAAVGWRATNSGANFIRILASLAAE